MVRCSSCGSVLHWVAAPHALLMLLFLSSNGLLRLAWLRFGWSFAWCGWSQWPGSPWRGARAPPGQRGLCYWAVPFSRLIRFILSYLLVLLPFGPPVGPGFFFLRARWSFLFLNLGEIFTTMYETMHITKQTYCVFIPT